jgi:long-chain acyl-CoA synthetase
LGAASFKSLPEMFQHRISSTPDAEAFYYPDSSEQWQTLRWRDVNEKVQAIAGGLMALGLALEERCSLMCSTRIDWVLCDFGIMMAGGATTTIYTSNTAEECEYIITDSDTVVVFVEDDKLAERILSIRDRIPKVKQVVNITGKAAAEGFVITLAELMEQGKKWNAANAGALQARAASVQSSHLATLIYTSGTTGRSKGVELTHDNWVFEAEAMDALGIMSPADKHFLWLPLAHSFGKVLECAIVRIGIPTAIDGRLDRIVANLAVVKPTFVAAVPRIFEKVYNKIVSGPREAGGLKLKIFNWASAVGKEVSQLRQKGQEPSGLLSLKYSIAEKLVFSKIQAVFGGRLRFFISGSAPLNRDIAEFLHGAGVLVLEGYGLTETSAASFVARPDKFAFGKVGVPLPGVQVKIDPSDGEILLGGRGIMRGYHNMAEVTQETITADGWLRTGDIGELDSEGFLRITDRKKELIKTSGGKYVAPSAIESLIKTACAPLVEHIVVHGDTRNYCSALVTVDPDALKAWRASQGKPEAAYAEASQDPELRALLQAGIDSVNQTRGSWETVKKFTVMKAQFTIDTEELTASQKLKRKFVEKKYATALNAMYEGN